VSFYILDTDHVTLFQHNHPKIIQRAGAIGNANIFVTTVTIEEQMRGRLAAISRAANQPEKLAMTHINLQSTLLYFCSINLLAFDDAAYGQYQRLLQAKLRVGTQDLRIAAIALSVQATVVTRNLQDFRRIPNLSLEDWSI
jgi:tRNA(fMet)-specific endonuclease VapC